MAAARRRLHLQLSLVLWGVFIVAPSAWSGPVSDKLVARADRLISQTSRLLVETDRLMTAATSTPSGLESPPEQTNPEFRTDKSANRANESHIRLASAGPGTSAFGSNDLGVRPAATIATPTQSLRQTDESRNLVEYRETGRRLDQQMARADQLIARTAQLMGEADRVLAQASPPSGSEPPASAEPQAPPTPNGGNGSKDKPESPTSEKPKESPGPAAATPGTPSKDQPAADAAAKDKPASAGATKDQPASGAAAQPQEEEREVARVPLAAVQAGGLLLPRDSLIVEPTVFYTYSQNTRLIVTGFSVLPLIILGTFESERLTNNLVSPALQLRYGLYRGLQLDFRVPYTYANQSRLRVSTENAGQVEESQHDAGIGDVSFGLTYQFLYERGWLPDLMFRIGASAPTGKSQFDIFRDIANKGGLVSAEAFLNAINTSGIAMGAGRWTISTTINGVKALDPGILFGTVGWNYTPESTEDLIQISATPVTGGVILTPTLVSSKLGAVNSFQGSIGLAISLNNQLSVNFSISELISAATKANGVKIPGSATNVGQFNFGMNLAVSPTTTVNFVSSMGITPDAPNLTLLMSVPVFFNNFGENVYGYVKSTFTDMFRRKPAPVEKPKETPKDKPKEGATG